MVSRLRLLGILGVACGGHTIGNGATTDTRADGASNLAGAVGSGGQVSVPSGAAGTIGVPSSGVPDASLAGSSGGRRANGADSSLSADTGARAPSDAALRESATADSGDAFGDCCHARAGAGCGNATVAQRVCFSYPSCCTSKWDFLCGRFASEIRVGACSPPSAAECEELVRECDADVGCSAVGECLRRTGCHDVGCSDSETCLGVLEQYVEGLPSPPSLRLILPLYFCNRPSDPTCACHLTW